MRPLLLALAVLLLAAPGASAGLTKAEPIDVGGVRIERSELQHWQRVAAHFEGRPRRWGATRYRRQAARHLIVDAWIEGEAPRHGVVVTRRQVEREIRDSILMSFPSHRAFRRFLRESGQTVRDIRWKFRMDLLFRGIREVVTRGIRSPEAQRAALEEFRKDHDARWSAVTSCSPRYHVADLCRAVTPPARGR